MNSLEARQRHNSEGKVYLVGAGPGNPELLSIRALGILEKADVVIYDRLVPKAVLNLIPKKVEKVYTSKRSGRLESRQRNIDDVMVSAAKKGKIVARLKGGDPFLFGRGGEEAQTLRLAGIPFEVVPGITSALAVPAYAGIPVTHRGYASSVVIATGHEDPDKSGNRVRWEELATSADTIVVIMGVRRLGSIVSRLIEGGLSPTTSVAIIENGATRHQRTTVGTLGDIVNRAKDRKVKPPAVIVVGRVVNLRNEISWFRESNRCH